MITTFYPRKLKGKYNLKHPGVEERMIIKWILKNLGIRM
jgi:hypothetical protein